MGINFFVNCVLTAGGQGGAELLTIDRRLNDLARDLRHLHDTVTLHVSAILD